MFERVLRRTPSNMRAFVAIDVPPFIEPLSAELRPEDHLTLHFFADLPAERQTIVAEAMGEAVVGFRPFDLEVRGVGAFPTPRHPRVVWAGVGEGIVTLQPLVERLRGALEVRGFPSEPRPFVPHLTLSRIRSGSDARWARRFLSDPANASRIWVRVRVTEVALKESELLPTGARHTVRVRVPLSDLGSPPPGTP